MLDVVEVGRGEREECVVGPRVGDVDHDEGDNRPGAEHAAKGREGEWLVVRRGHGGLDVAGLFLKTK